MYDISIWIKNGFGAGITDEKRTELLNQLGEKRWEDFENDES